MLGGAILAAGLNYWLVTAYSLDKLNPLLSFLRGIIGIWFLGLGSVLGPARRAARSRRPSQRARSDAKTVTLGRVHAFLSSNERASGDDLIEQVVAWSVWRGARSSSLTTTRRCAGRSELLYSLHDIDTVSAGSPADGLALLDGTRHRPRRSGHELHARHDLGRGGDRAVPRRCASAIRICRSSCSPHGRTSRRRCELVKAGAADYLAEAVGRREARHGRRRT